MRALRARCAHAPHQLTSEGLLLHAFGMSLSMIHRSIELLVSPQPQFMQVATKEEESLPPWIRNERERKLQAEEGSDLPFPVYLIGSSLVAIAAVRCLTPCS